MTNTERFEGLRRRAIDQNEERYGAEARARHGDAAVDAANEHLSTLSEQEWNDMNALENAIIEQLATAMKTGDPAGEEAAKLASMHARWIQQHWGPDAYTPEAHRQLVQGYLADERFRAYYDSRAGDGATDFLAAAITRNV